MIPAITLMLPCSFLHHIKAALLIRWPFGMTGNAQMNPDSDSEVVCTGMTYGNQARSPGRKVISISDTLAADTPRSSPSVEGITSGMQELTFPSKSPPSKYAKAAANQADGGSLSRRVPVRDGGVPFAAAGQGTATSGAAAVAATAAVDDDYMDGEHCSARDLARQHPSVW